MEKISNYPAIIIEAKDNIKKKDITSFFIPLLLATFFSFGFTIPNQSCDFFKLNKKLKNKSLAVTVKQTLLDNNEVDFHPLMLMSRFE